MRVCSVLSALVLVCAAPAFAQIDPAVSIAPNQAARALPRLVKFSGTLPDARGTVAVTFALYRDQTGGTPLWQEVQEVTPDANGRYAIYLGAASVDGVPLDLFTSGEARWLGVRMAGQQELSRVMLVSVPYALAAGDAQTLGGKPASAYLQASNDPAATSGAPMGTARQAAISSGSLVGTNSFATDGVNVQFTDTSGTLTGYSVQNLGASASSYSGMLFFDQNGALGQFQGFNNSTHEYRINNIASSGSINFMIGSSSKFRVGTDGHIGIGTTAPFGTELLSVNAGGKRGIEADSTGDFALIGNTTIAGDTGGTGVVGEAGTGKGVWAYSTSGYGLYVSGSGSVQAVFAGNGSVGIGTATPADKLQVLGDIRVGTGTTGCVKDADGTIIAGTCSSDRRLKKGITPFAFTLDKLTRLQPVHFHWRGDEYPDRHFGTAESFGLVAQDVEGVLPELVTTDETGFKAVRYSALPLYMLQAIKELKAENDQLKARLSALESAAKATSHP